MRKLFTNLLLTMLTALSVISTNAQCDQVGYSDLSGPCAASICAADAFCCDFGWDGMCAAAAAIEPACQYCWTGCYDNDLDGFTNCDGDCDDFDASVNPGAEDICGNGIDEDCSGFDLVCDVFC
jgi:hypothetical protein